MSEQTYEAILKREMARVPGDLDTREGSLIWYANAPGAVELVNLNIAVEEALNNGFADTASRKYLIRRAAERGLSPQAASAAILELTTTPAEIEISLGTRFSIGALNYAITKRVAAGVYEITCETPGEAGNDYSDTCIPIEYVKGLETCTVTALLIPGEDEEATEIFRQRYFSSLHAQAFGGNRQDYIEKVNAIPGVGAVKVYRAWNSDIAPASLLPPEGTDAWLETLPGIPEEIKNWLDTMYLAASQSKLTVGGTVKLVILDSTLSKPSSTLVELVQTTIDPTQNAGEGLGLAPIGHVVKEYGADEEVINLDFAVYCRRGLAWEDVCDAAADAVKDYFRELTQSWADTDGPLIVRVAQVESHLLTVPGILDVGRTALNGREVNLTLTSDHIPVLGTISAHAAAIS